MCSPSCNLTSPCQIPTTNPSHHHYPTVTNYNVHFGNVGALLPLPLSTHGGGVTSCRFFVETDIFTFGLCQGKQNSTQTSHLRIMNLLKPLQTRTERALHPRTFDSSSNFLFRSIPRNSNSTASSTRSPPPPVSPLAELEEARGKEAPCGCSPAVTASYAFSPNRLPSPLPLAKCPPSSWCWCWCCGCLLRAFEAPAEGSRGG